MFLKTLNIFVGVNLMFTSFVIWAEEIKATPWVKLKIGTEQSSKICKVLNANQRIDCSNDISIWKIKSSTDNKLYLTDSTPQLFEIEKTNQTYKIINHWDFKNYQHHSTNSSDGELGDYGTEIFPAFYPLNQQQHAIALVRHWGTGYSGGGRGEQVADFIMLKPQGKFKVALTSIPFYSYKMIRACFSERDYKTSPHCHDESGSTLSIQFRDVGKAFYQWTLNYTDFTWDAGKSEKSKKIEKYSEVVMPSVR